MLTKHLRFQSKPWWPGATEDFQEEKVVELGRTTVEGERERVRGKVWRKWERRARAVASVMRFFLLLLDTAFSRIRIIRGGRAKRMKRVLRPSRSKLSL